MTARYLDDLFSRNLHFQDVAKCEDVKQVAGDATEITIDRNTRNAESIATLTRLRKLSATSMRRDVLSEVAKLKSLQVLHVGYSPYTDLSELRKLAKVRCLLLSNLPKVQTVEFLQGMAGLKALEIADLRRVTDLSPLSALSNLVELKIDSGGMRGNQITVATLTPLAELQRLRHLWLYVRSEDHSLQALSHLQSLKSLSINGFYPWQEYAKLAACLPKVDCRWLRNKYLEWRYPTCKKCGAKRMIAPPGKGKRAFCGDCYPTRIDSLISEYDQQYEIGASGNW